MKLSDFVIDCSYFKMMLREWGRHWINNTEKFENKALMMRIPENNRNYIYGYLLKDFNGHMYFWSSPEQKYYNLNGDEEFIYAPTADDVHFLGRINQSKPEEIVWTTTVSWPGYAVSYTVE